MRHGESAEKHSSDRIEQPDLLHSANGDYRGTLLQYGHHHCQSFESEIREQSQRINSSKEQKTSKQQEHNKDVV